MAILAGDADIRDVFPSWDSLISVGTDCECFRRDKKMGYMSLSSLGNYWQFVQNRVRGQERFMGGS